MSASTATPQENSLLDGVGAFARAYGTENRAEFDFAMLALLAMRNGLDAGSDRLEDGLEEMAVDLALQAAAPSVGLLARRLVFGAFRKSFLAACVADHSARRVDFLLRRIPLDTLLRTPEHALPDAFHATERRIVARYREAFTDAERRAVLVSAFRAQRALWLKRSLTRNAPMIFLWGGLLAGIVLTAVVWGRMLPASVWELLARWWEFLARI